MIGLGLAMALQFKPDGRGGWLYRRDQVGAPLPTTGAERDGYVRWYGWIVASSVVMLMALVMLFAWIATVIAPSPSDNVGALGALAMGGSAFALTYLYLKWFSHAPARAFADRPPVGPARSRKQVFGRRMARFGYLRLTLVVAGLIGVGLVALRDQPGAWWLPFALFVPIGLGFAYWKWSIEREPD